MGVELRNGRPYLYNRTRVNGRIRCEYCGPLSSKEVTYFRGLAESAQAMRTVEYRDRQAEARGLDVILAAGAEFERLADRLFRAVMHLTGHTLHNRSEWRRKRGVRAMATIQETGAPPRAGITTRSAPPPLDAEAQQIIAQAGRGAPVLLAFLELTKSPTALESLGYPAAMARSALVGMLARTEPSIARSILDRCERDTAKLLAECGPDPSFAEWMAAARVVNNWLTVHTLESFFGTHSAAVTSTAAFDKRLTQAEKRLHASLKSLAVMRRLRKPVTVTQVNIAKGGPLVVNNGAPEGRP